MRPTEPPASTRYELCEPTKPKLWVLKAVGAVVASMFMQDDPGYRGGTRLRVRGKDTGDFVYDATFAPGLAADEGLRTISADLDGMAVDEFERAYSIDRRWDR